MLKLEHKVADTLSKLDVINSHINQLLAKGTGLSEKESKQIDMLYAKKKPYISFLEKVYADEKAGNLLRSNKEIVKRFNSSLEKDKLVLDSFNTTVKTLEQDLKKTTSQKKLLIYSKEN